MLVIVVTLTVHEVHREAFRLAILANASTSLDTEPGCVRFDVCEDATGVVFFLYEHYVDDAAFDLHLLSPHFLAFNEASAPWVQSKRVERYRLLDNPASTRLTDGSHGQAR